MSIKSFAPILVTLAVLALIYALDLPKTLGAHPWWSHQVVVVSGGLGIVAVLMDEHLAGPELSSGALVEVSPVSFTYGGYFLAVNKRASRRKAVRAVRGWLLEEAAKSVAASG